MRALAEASSIPAAIPKPRCENLRCIRACLSRSDTGQGMCEAMLELILAKIISLIVTRISGFSIPIALFISYI